MYRILTEEMELKERRNQLRHPAYSKPELLATGPNQVWSWDITKLKGPQKSGQTHLIYLIIDACVPLCYRKLGQNGTLYPTLL